MQNLKPFQKGIFFFFCFVFMKSDLYNYIKWYLCTVIKILIKLNKEIILSKNPFENIRNSSFSNCTSKTTIELILQFQWCFIVRSTTKSCLCKFLFISYEIHKVLTLHKYQTSTFFKPNLLVNCDLESWLDWGTYLSKF